MTFIFGHRGLPEIYRENSIEGLNKAFDHCDFVETDLRITKDNNIIFYHDSFIKGFFIQDLTLNEIELLLPDIDLNDMIFNSEANIRSLKKDFETIKLEYNYLSSTEKLLEFQNLHFH